MPERPDVLAAELTALGRSVPDDDTSPAVLEAAVMRRLGEQPAGARRPREPVREWARRYRRRIAVLAAAVVLVLAGTPAVRAAVAEFLGLGPVRVRIDPAPPSATPSPLSGDVTLEQARDLVAFTPVELPELGAPQEVAVSRGGQVLSLSWRDGTVRVDQIDGRLDFAFVKSAPGVRFVSAGDGEAMWFPGPHDVAVLDDTGATRSETARLAGPTLVWEQGGTVIRLEGIAGLDRALEIAGSAR